MVRMFVKDMLFLVHAILRKNTWDGEEPKKYAERKRCEKENGILEKRFRNIVKMLLNGSYISDDNHSKRSIGVVYKKKC